MHAYRISISYFCFLFILDKYISNYRTTHTVLVILFCKLFISLLDSIFILFNFARFNSFIERISFLSIWMGKKSNRKYFECECIIYPFLVRLCYNTFCILHKWIWNDDVVVNCWFSWKRKTFWNLAEILHSFAPIHLHYYTGCFTSIFTWM